MYPVYQNQSQGPLTHGVKFLDRFYVAMSPCPAVVSMNLRYFNTLGISPLKGLQRGCSQIL